MDLYQKLWQQKFPNNQMVIDWDTFIKYFSQVVLQSVSISLSQTHKNILSGLIDPQHRNQIYKNGYLLFIDHFWSITSNRSKFLALKINLSDFVIRKKQEKQNSKDLLQLQIQYKDYQNYLRIQKYQITPLTVKRVFYYSDKMENNNDKNNNNNKSQEKFRALMTNDFISIGSDFQKNDIIIQSIHINTTHIKIIHKQLPKPQIKSFFAKKTIQQKTPWYIRDISRSNRLKFQINDFQLQYLVLKSGLQFQIGQLKQYLIIVKTCPSVVKQNIDNLQINLNSDRFDQYGNQSKPIKDIINFDLQDLSSNDVIKLFDMSLYYPDKNLKLAGDTNNNINSNTVTSNNNNFQKDQQKVSPIIFHILHKPTLKQFIFDSKKRNKFWIGRQQSSQLRIDSICIRQKQCFIQNINGAWILRAYDVNVYLSNQNQCKNDRNSNRQKIIQTRQQFYQSKEFKMRLKVITPQKQFQDYY